jgi:DNA-binding FadR family transcriptional regulator
MACCRPANCSARTRSPPFPRQQDPVREALKHLEAKGLVTFLRNRGAVVASLSAAEIDEYMEIRAMLEARAARLAAPLISEQAIERRASILTNSPRPPTPAAGAS